jgi:SAM-dependent methyltransferase
MSEARLDDRQATRLEREIEHHRRIATRAEVVWNWDSPAGRRRAQRRAELFVAKGGLRPGRRALEVGCGTGIFLERVAASGATITAVDLSTELLARARERVKGMANVALARGNAEEMPYPDRSFDAVYGSSILHHLDLERALREIHRVLRPGGAIVFAEPNILNPQIVFMFRFPPVKERFGVSPDEMAFSRFRAARVLRGLGYTEVQVTPHDFLHPSLPASLVDAAARWGTRAEKVPILREIAGSLLIHARKA